MGRRKRSGAFYESFGQRLVELMEKKQLRPKELADRMGVDPGTVTKWKAGSMPDPDSLPKLARILGTTPAALQGLATAPDLGPAVDVVAVKRELAEVGFALAQIAERLKRLGAHLPDD